MPIRKPLISLCVLFTASVNSAEVSTKPQPLTGPRPSPQTIQAWKARKFGMFIHFGLYSTLGGVWQGRQIARGYSEQIQSHAPIPMNQYAPLAKNFNPTKFDPDAIVRLAKDAGMTYIVLTSKHHDGFNMFRTKLTKYNIVDATPYGKDVVKQLADACARGGLKFGVYYSSIDWHYPGASTWIDSNNNPIPKAHEDFSAGQLRELMSNYGPLTEIWFDMGHPTPAQSRRFASTVHTLQPQCMVSGRVFNHQGDFTVMGDNEVPDFVIDEPWQTPASIYTDTWGYRSWARRDDLPGKIKEHILTMAQVVSRGGNYLLNIGPRGDGSVVDFEADVLRGVGAWLKANGEAIYGADPQPFRQLDFGYATVKNNRLYLLVRDRPADDTLRLPGLATRLQRAYLLADPAKTPLSISSQQEPFIRLPRKLAASPLTTVVAEFAGKLYVRPTLQQPDAAGTYTLTNKAADHFVNYNGADYADPPTTYKLQWNIGLKSTARYRISISYDKPGKPCRIQLLVGGKPLTVDIKELRQGTTFAGTLDLPEADSLAVDVTPLSPFPKGEALGATIQQVELKLTR